MTFISSNDGKTFIIAEAGVNHNGSLALAKQLVDVAVAANADAVKFQLFQAEDLVCAHAPKAPYQLKTEPHESQFEMLKALELNQEQQRELHAYCQKKEILFLSSPFDVKSVEFLDQLNVPLLKIPSGEITHFPLLVKIGETGRPCILSTGMSTLGEIEMALTMLKQGYSTYATQQQVILAEKIALLHCTSEYPAPFSAVNLHAMETLQRAFGLTTGYSDHTVGIATAIAAVAKGAKIIEKHFTLDKKMPGPDHAASLSPDELSLMVISIREVEMALGNYQKTPAACELENRQIARKSLVALQTIRQGEKFTSDNMGCKRPGNGVSAALFYDYIHNQYARRHYQKDELIEA